MQLMQNSHFFSQQTGSRMLKEGRPDNAFGCLQGTHDLYRTDAMTLPYWIITFGATYFVFAMCVPHLHGLRWWSSISSILVIVFMAIIFGVSIHDGKLHVSWHSTLESPYMMVSCICHGNHLWSLHTRWYIACVMATIFGVSILDGTHIHT